MLSRKWRMLFTQTITGCIALCMSFSVSAASWKVAPYGFSQGGICTRMDWSLDLADKFLLEGTTFFGGTGFLFDPSKLDDWLISIEGLYYRHIARSQEGTGEHGFFISGKCTFPRAESVENFFGIGLGGLWLTRTPKKDEANLSGAVIVYGGRNWHMSNGRYFTVRCSYLFPGADNRKQSLSTTVGFQWHWI